MPYKAEHMPFKPITAKKVSRNILDLCLFFLLLANFQTDTEIRVGVVNLKRAVKDDSCATGLCP